MATIDDVKASYKAIVRVDLNDTQAQATAAAITAGQITLAQYQASLISQSAPTTQAALSLSALITGTVPSSDKLDSLTAFAKTQNDYYTSVLKSSNAALGAYEALGRAYASDATTSASFAARFGGLSTADFITAAYATAFTAAPTAGAIANLTAQVTYFTNLYTSAGIPAAEASLQAKGAVFGQIVGYAATAPATGGASTLDDTLVTTLQTIANQAVSKTDSTVYGKALPGVTGAALTIAADQSISLDSVTAGLKSTTGNDIISGTISGATKDVSVNTAAGDDSIGTATAAVTITQVGTNKISIDGSAGNDSLYAKLGSALTTNTTIANVEKIYLDGNNLSAAATNWTGVQEIWAFKTTGTTTVTDIASGVKIGIQDSAQGATFAFKAGAASADLTLNNAAGSVAVTGADLKSLSINVATKSELSQLGTGAETITVSGSGDLSIANVALGTTPPLTATVKTFDASAATGSITLGSTGNFYDQSVASTIKLGSGADKLFVQFSDQLNDTITLGGGKDAVTVSNTLSNLDFSTVGTATSETINTFATITDFVKGEDTLKFSGLTALTPSVVGSASLKAALDIAVTDTDAATGVYFEFQGSTYIFKDNAASGGTTGSLSDGDGLIKLAGVTGLTVGAAGTGIDLINV